MCKKSDPPCLSPADEARARSGLYALLARVFRSEPDGELLRQLRAMDEVEISAVVPCPDNRTPEAQQDLLMNLAVEYTRLFLGPGHRISLHESVLAPGGKGRLHGEKTVAVARFMAAAGFALPTPSPWLPDHLAVELEFMAHLCTEEAQHRTAGDETEARNAASWQADFLSRHLGTWVSVVRERVETAEPSTFYVAHAEWLCDFVHQELHSIGATGTLGS